jgi:hypothetical protein
MTIIREVCRDNVHAWCVLRTDTYASSVAHIERLVAAAREDFPHLTNEDIEVVFSRVAAGELVARATAALDQRRLSLGFALGESAGRIRSAIKAARGSAGIVASMVLDSLEKRLGQG